MEPEMKPQMGHKVLLALIIGLGIGLIAGWGIARTLFQKKATALKAEVTSEIRKNLVSKGLIGPEGVEENQGELASLTGIVTEIGNSSITIERIIQSNDPLAANTSESIIVQVNQETVLALRLEKDVETLIEEQLAWEQSFNSDDIDGPAAEPPNPFTENPVGLQDFQSGDSVTVEFTEAYTGGGNAVAAKVFIEQGAVGGGAPEAALPPPGR